jgi:Ca2+-binding RTX toxin-like protein
VALFKTADAIVNASATGTQDNSAVTQLADGRYVVTWSSVNGGTEDIHAQIYNPDGTVSTADFVVTTASGIGVAATNVTALPTGGFAVVWQQGVNTTQDVYYKAFTADGQPLGGAAAAPLMSIASATTKEWAPSVATIGAGGVIAAWVNDAGAVVYRAFKIETNTASANLGQLVVDGTETTIAAAGVTPGVRIDITALADGRFVMQWINATSGNATAQMFTSAGVADGVSFAVNTATTITDAKMDALANGGWVSTYTSGTNLFFQKFTDAGVKDGAEVTVSNLTGNQAQSDVAQLADGRMAVVWASNELGHYDIHMRVYSATGAAMGDDFVVNTVTANDQSKPSIQALADGRYVVSWTTSIAGSLEIQQSIYDPSYYTGTSGADIWTGGDSSDRMFGGAGNDTLTGNDGADYIQGGDGNDLLYAGLGNDTVYGDAGTDTIKGDDGNDKLYGGDDIDNIDGGAGNDVIEGGAGYNGTIGDTLTGGSGVDTVSYYHSLLGVTVNLGTNAFSGGDATGDKVTANTFDNVTGSVVAGDTITGDAFNNVLSGLGGVDTINGGKGNDTILGGDGNDTLKGGDGTDTIFGGAGVDTILGEIGNDKMIGGSGNDSYNGGAGVDTLSFQYELSGVTFSLDGSLTAAGAATGDTIVTTAGNETENLFGSNYNDTLKGSNISYNGGSALKPVMYSNKILGLGGDDNISGLDGNDTLQGGDGIDTVSGGNGNDNIDGGNGDDILTGNADVDTITGGNGIDTITGGADADKLNGGAGNDIFIWNNTTEFGDIMTGLDKGIVTAGVLTSGDVFKFNSTNILGLSTYDQVNDFVVNTTGLAGDAADRFIWKSTDDTLWYDRDGTGATYASVLVADFNTTYVLNALQIVIL